MGAKNEPWESWSFNCSISRFFLLLESSAYLHIFVLLTILIPTEIWKLIYSPTLTWHSEKSNSGIFFKYNRNKNTLHKLFRMLHGKLFFLRTQRFNFATYNCLIIQLKIVTLRYRMQFKETSYLSDIPQNNLIRKTV